MNYETQSSKAIVAKVYRDLGTQDQNWETDAIEWIGEAMEKIGAAPAYEDKEEIYAVQSHKMGMPAGVMQMRGLWKAEGINYTVASDGDVTVDQQALKKATKIRIPRKQGSGRRLRSGVGPKGTVEHRFDGNSKYYILNPGYIHTSFEKALVIFGYKGIVTDTDGFPVIPKNATYDEALSWYVIYRILMRNPSTHPQMDLSFAKQQWEQHKHRAKSVMKMPDPDEYEHFEQTWVHMIQPKMPHRQHQLVGGGTYQGSDLVNSQI